MRTLNGHVLVAAAVLAIFVYAAFETQRLSTRSRQFPTAIAIPALVLGAFQLVREFRAARAGLKRDVPIEARTAARSAAWFAAFFGLAWLAGILASVPLFTLLYLRWEAREPWWRAAIYAAAAWAFLYLVFVQVLHVPLPIGVIHP